MEWAEASPFGPIRLRHVGCPGQLHVAGGFYVIILDGAVTVWLVSHLRPLVCLHILGTLLACCIFS